MTNLAGKAALYRKIHAVMGAMAHVEKRGRNEFHKYDYVMAADVIEKARELFITHGLVLLPSVQACDHVEFSKGERGGMDHRARVTVAYTIADIETGESVELVFKGEGQDSTDKAIYKAYTGAFKYFLIDTFLIPTGDDPENDGATQPRAKGQAGQYQQRTQTTQRPPVAQRPATATQPQSEREVLVAALRVAYQAFRDSGGAGPALTPEIVAGMTNDQIKTKTQELTTLAKQA